MHVYKILIDYPITSSMLSSSMICRLSHSFFIYWIKWQQKQVFLVSLLFKKVRGRGGGACSRGCACLILWPMGLALVRGRALIRGNTVCRLTPYHSCIRHVIFFDTTGQNFKQTFVFSSISDANAFDNQGWQEIQRDACPQATKKNSFFCTILRGWEIQM